MVKGLISEEATKIFGVGGKGRPLGWVVREVHQLPSKGSS